MKLLLLSILTSILFSDSIKNMKYELEHLSPAQLYIMNEIFKKAEPFDYGYTMVAIAWQESHFGKYQINLSDPSCGIFHVMPKYISKSKWGQSRICERLISDFDFSFTQSLEKLKYFENYHKSKGHSKIWSRTVQSYNAGFNSNKGIKYLNDIKTKIKLLKNIYK